VFDELISSFFYPSHIETHPPKSKIKLRFNQSENKREDFFLSPFSPELTFSYHVVLTIIN